MSHKLTEHFTWEEFDCHDGTKVPLHLSGNVKLLATNLEALRRACGKPITIVSGYRTNNHNRTVGGSPKSQHLTASAADIRIEGLTAKEIAAVIVKLIGEGRMTQGGLGIYPTWVHYDIRGVKARW